MLLISGDYKWEAEVTTNLFNSINAARRFGGPFIKYILKIE